MTLDFVLPVDKPVGPTSHDVVAAARRALGTRRVGHTGTLDPFASGLLLLCLGRATRLAEYLTGLPKTYEAVARLGVTTDTEDHTGTVLEEREGWAGLDFGAVQAVAAGFLGAIDQVPPQFSAKKVDGVRMHERARRGERVELEPRRVTIHELEVLEVAPPEARFRVVCSSGTYVRSLARDLGEALGCGAHLSALRRTGIGDFAVGDAVSVDALDDASAVAGAAMTPMAALRHLPAVEVDGAGAARLAHGQQVDAPGEGEGLVAVGHEGALVAIGEVRAGRIAPRKVFVS